MILEDVLRRRLGPRVYVLDESGELALGDSRGVLPDELLALVRRAIPSAPTLLKLNIHGDVHLVRVLPLEGQEGKQQYAVVIELRRSREPVLEAFDRYRLSPREVEVLSLIIQGAPNRTIAETLYIAETTVQNHVRNLCDKVGARRRGDLLARVFDVNET